MDHRCGLHWVNDKSKNNNNKKQMALHKLKGFFTTKYSFENKKTSCWMVHKTSDKEVDIQDL